MAESALKQEGPSVTSVFSAVRDMNMPELELPPQLQVNVEIEMEGIEFLGLLPSGKIPVAFLDPQYRGLLDKMSYGNEGRSRSKARCSLPQMDENTIGAFVREIDRVLMPSGHLFLWTDKYHLCTGIDAWRHSTNLKVVDLVTWDKGRIGMGYRTRRRSEYLVVLQKEPLRAKGVWKTHDIPDVWKERVSRQGETHRKPVRLQAALLEAVSNPGDLVIDPAAGSFSVLEACHLKDRHFLGCDIAGKHGTD